MTEIKDQDILRDLKQEVTSQVNPPHGPKHIIQVEVFHGMANRMDALELEIITLKAALYDATCASPPERPDAP